MDKDLINRRFNEAIFYLLEKGYAETKFEISNKLFITPTKLSETLSGRLNVSTEVVARLAQNYPQISLEWIMLGEGKIANANNCPPELGGQLDSLSAPKTVPLSQGDESFARRGSVNSHSSLLTPHSSLPLLPISAVAGWNGVDVEGVNLDECERVVVPYLVEAGAEFLIRATGKSMQPTYNNGDILACRRVREARNIQWGKVYVIDSEEGPMVKRLKKSEDEECILCISDNPEYDPFELRKDEIRSVSLVVGSIQVE